jgi:hypothetical protein
MDSVVDFGPVRAPATLVTAQSKQKASIVDTLKAIATESGGSYGFVAKYMKVAQKPGRMIFDEFVAMRLWDQTLYGSTDIREFIGYYGMRDIFLIANFDHMAYGLMQNKIAANAILAEHGLPTIPTAAFHCQAGGKGIRKSSTPTELADMLLERLEYPIFCKPLNGLQSLGTASFDACDRAARTLVRQDGTEINADQFALEVHTAYGKGGYLIQPRVRPAKEIADVCGQRTATVRVLTILDEGTPKIIRACWKIPGGANSADNYWREGNLLAGVDVETGAVGQPMTGKGLSYRVMDNHPDTGARITGMTIPQWQAIKETALAGAAVMSQFGLVGWDITASEAGPVIVEMNETPDFTLPQMAEKKGVYDAEFADFIKRMRKTGAATRKAEAAQTKREVASVFF